MPRSTASATKVPWVGMFRRFAVWRGHDIRVHKAVYAGHGKMEVALDALLNVLLHLDLGLLFGCDKGKVVTPVCVERGRK